MLLVITFVFILLGNGRCYQNNMFYQNVDRNIRANAECEVQKEALLNGLQNGDDWTIRSRFYVYKILKKFNYALIKC